jgi:histidyl-tRNA synthetase
MIKAVRGTRDLLPPETALWNFVEAAVRDVFRAYNFHEIRTPIFEETQLFARSVGEETDIVEKEMYTWLDGKASGFETLMLSTWMMKHQGEIKTPTFERVFENRARPDLVVEMGERLVVVEFKRRTINQATISNVKQYRKAFTEAFPQRTDPKFLLVFAEDPTFYVRHLAEANGVDIEVIEIPGYEPPQSLTLRPENTAGVVRAYIEHKLWDRGLNKLYYIGPQFRRERPQKGRYRQFYQIGAEVIGPPSAGSESPARDAEILELLATLLDRLGIENWTLELNSVGCPADRAAYNDALRKALEPVVGQMCTDCQRRAVTNPLRVFDCKVPADQPIIEKLPRISQFLDEPCRRHFEQVQEILKSVGVEFQLNDRLVRGLDYYSRTAFEFTHGALGAQNAILGGGRYDGLSESLGGPSAPGIGFAIGEDRLVLALDKSAEAVLRKPDVYIAALGAGMDREAARLARELRRHDIIAELGDETFRLKKSFETAAKLGARFILIVGENEVKADAFALKNLESGEQVSVPRAELAQRLQSNP